MHRKYCREDRLGFVQCQSGACYKGLQEGAVAVVILWICVVGHCSSKRDLGTALVQARLIGMLRCQVGVAGAGCSADVKIPGAVTLSSLIPRDMLMFSIVQKLPTSARLGDLATFAMCT